MADTVEVIGLQAFRSNGKLTQVKLSAGLKHIAKEAFMYCDGLASLILPNGLHRIDRGAFRNTSLQMLSIPASVTNISEAFISGAKYLQKISVSSQNPVYYTDSYGVLFNNKSGSSHTLIAYPAGSPSSTYMVPEGTKRIGSHAFSVAGRLQEVVLPKGLAAIGNDAFDKNENLQVVTIPQGTVLNNNAFVDCPHLQEVWFFGAKAGHGNTVFKTSDSVIYNTVNIYYPAAETAYAENTETWIHPKADRYILNPFSGEEIRKDHPKFHYVFINGGSAIEVVKYIHHSGEAAVPPSIRGIPVVSVRNGTFDGCSHVSTVHLPKTVISVGETAFDGCINLENFQVHPLNPAFAADKEGVLYSLQNGKKHTLLHCPPMSGITEFSVPSGVVAIGDNAFRGCTLSRVVFSETVTTIGKGAFAGVPLNGLSLDSTITSIGEGAFHGCGTMSVFCGFDYFDCASAFDADAKLCYRDTAKGWETVTGASSFNELYNRLYLQDGIKPDHKHDTGEPILRISPDDAAKGNLQKYLYKNDGSSNRMAVLDLGGKELAVNAPIGTGTRVRLLSKDGEVLDEFHIVVIGDVTGDGIFTEADVEEILSARNYGKKTFAAANPYADVNNDGVVDVADIETLCGIGVN